MKHRERQREGQRERELNREREGERNGWVGGVEAVAAYGATPP